LSAVNKRRAQDDDEYLRQARLLPRKPVSAIVESHRFLPVGSFSVFIPVRIVKSQIIRANGEPVKVDYMMRLSGENWLISDIYPSNSGCNSTIGI
jgi:hypothetical protein